MKILKSKTFWILALLLGATALFGNDFQGVDDVVAETNTSARKTIGTAIHYVFGFLPLVGFIVVGALGMKNAKNKSEQDKDNKVFTAGIIWAVAGAMLGILGDALLGAMLLGDSSKGLQLLFNFWGNVSGVGGSSDPVTVTPGG